MITSTSYIFRYDYGRPNEIESVQLYDQVISRSYSFYDIQKTSVSYSYSYSISTLRTTTKSISSGYSIFFSDREITLSDRYIYNKGNLSSSMSFKDKYSIYKASKKLSNSTYSYKIKLEDVPTEKRLSTRYKIGRVKQTLKAFSAKYNYEYNTSSSIVYKFGYDNIFHDTVEPEYTWTGDSVEVNLSLPSYGMTTDNGDTITFDTVILNGATHIYRILRYQFRSSEYGTTKTKNGVSVNCENNIVSLQFLADKKAPLSIKIWRAEL